MFARPSTSAAGLLSPHIPRNCTRCSLPLPLRQRNVFARFQTTDSDPYDPAESAPRYKRKPKRRPRFKKDEHKRIPIGVTALGEPGEVVVVSSPRRRRPLPKNLPNNSDTVDKNALPFMLNELEDNEDILDGSAVNETIESFCAQCPPRAKLPPTDYDKLRTNLQLSFTTRQLSDYVLQFAEGESARAEARVDNGNMDGAEWKPGTSSFLETSLRSQGGIADRVAPSQSLTGKQLIAERILRDCWHLGVIDELGQLDVRLPLHSLTLLLYSQHFSFEELASLHEAKIDVTNSLGLVRITGRQQACESIREIVYDATNRIRVEELNLSSVAAIQSKESGRIFTADFLSWISRTYGVAFEESSGCPSKIFYLVENKQDADNARRTLNLATYEASSPPIPFGTYLPSSEPVAVSSVDPENNVSWFDRQKTWFRWAVPSTQTAEATSATPLFDKHQTRLSDELLKLLRATSPTVNEGGSVQVHESVTAAVGRCLFQQKPSFQDADATASQLGRMSLPRTFTTDIPRVASFLRTLTPHLPEEPQRPHRIRLIPSALHAGVFPPIDLEVSVQKAHADTGSGADVLVRSAKAILSEGNVDYLLPESGLDLRFSRKLTHDLSETFINGSSSEIVQKTLRDLIFKSFSTESETPLPAFTPITLSNDVLSQPADPAGYSTGEYMFMPVNDIRGTRVHQYDFKGKQLSYAFYESGPFASYRTTELMLDMDLTDKVEANNNLSTEGASSDEPVQREFNSFYTAACSLSFELDRVWRMM